MRNVSLLALAPWTSSTAGRRSCAAGPPSWRRWSTQPSAVVMGMAGGVSVMAGPFTSAPALGEGIDHLEMGQIDLAQRAQEEPEEPGKGPGDPHVVVSCAGDLERRQLRPEQVRDVHVHLAGAGRLRAVVERDVERGGLRPRGQAWAAVDLLEAHQPVDRWCAAADRRQVEDVVHLVPVRRLLEPPEE